MRTTFCGGPGYGGAFVRGPMSQFKNCPTEEGLDILVVDDSSANLLAIEAVLADVGCTVVRAQSGLEALRLVLKRDFALILMDVQMPSLNGFETARLIRERPRSRHTPIIFITGYERDPKIVMDAYSLGAVDFLFKPIVGEILRSKVRVFVELRRQTEKASQQADLLREHERREAKRIIEQERRRWQQEALRKQRDDAQEAARVLEKKTEELSRTIEAKERAEEELVRINRALAEADQRKDEFLALLGHELRNPLATITIGLELLRRKLDGISLEDPSLTRVHLTVVRQTRHLSRLVDDLLDISRINSGRLELRREPTPLRDLVENAVAASRPWIDERQHEITVDVPDEEIVCDADAVRLTQVLANLLNNAARHTGRRGRIYVVVSNGDDQITITISDSGPGIDPAIAARIFEPFVQSKRTEGGLGLGLTLVKRVVELHGGSIAARNNVDSPGAAFEVRLPRRITRSTTRPANVAEKAAWQRDKRIVIVDDNDEIRATLTELLGFWYHRIESASDGLAGLDLICKVTPDVAIVDIGLPKLDGYAVATKVRERLGSNPVLLVAISGYGQAADRHRALKAGFDVHLVKPIDVDELAELIEGRLHEAVSTDDRAIPEA